MGREGETPDIDFKAPEVAGEEKERDQALLDNFVKHYGNETQHDFQSFNHITEDADFPQMLEALSQDHESQNAVKVSEVLQGIVNKRLEQYSGGNAGREAPEKLMWRMGVHNAESHLSVMRLIQEKTGILGDYIERMDEFQEKIEQFKRNEK